MSTVVSKEFFKVIKERTGNPLVRTYIFTFLIWNYKFFFLLFSDIPILDRFQELKNLVSSSGLVSSILISFGFSSYPILHVIEFYFWPLVLTCLYIFYLPFFSKKVYKKWQSDQNEMKRAKATLAEVNRISLEESIEIRTEIASLQEENENLKSKESKLIIKNKNLQNLVRSLKTENRVLHNASDTFFRVFEHNILELIGTSTGKSHEDLKSDLKKRDITISDLEITKIIDFLEEEEWIKRGKSKEYEDVYNITEDGTKYLNLYSKILNDKMTTLIRNDSKRNDSNIQMG